MSKIWAIASLDIRNTFSDRNLLLIMFAAPLALATIISLAFGGGSSSILSDIPVAIVNQDEGTDVFNGGQIITSAFAVSETAAQTSGSPPACEQAAGGAASDSGAAPVSLDTLTNAALLDDPVAAHAGVDRGDYAAAVIIPAGFSRSISYSQQSPQLQPVPIEVYGSSDSAISAGVIRSIVEGFTNQFMTGQIAIAATIDTMVRRAQENLPFGLQFAAASAGGAFQPDFSCAFTPALNAIRIEQQTVTGQQVDFNPLVVFGSAQAVFFALFTANGGSANILKERRNGTLQRLIVSPTPRLSILIGKLIGVFFVVLIQLAFLFVAFTVIGSLLEGEITFIWGTNWPAVIILVAATSVATAGVGMVTAAAGKTPEQAQIIGSIIAMLMGILGGAFFSVQALGPLEVFTRLSVVRWGSEGFTKLASGQGDILPNVFFLLVIGAVLFALSLWIFNRRQDV